VRSPTSLVGRRSAEPHASLNSD